MQQSASAPDLDQPTSLELRRRKRRAESAQRDKMLLMLPGIDSSSRSDKAAARGNPTAVDIDSTSDRGDGGGGQGAASGEEAVPLSPHSPQIERAPLTEAELSLHMSALRQNARHCRQDQSDRARFTHLDL